MAYASAGLGAAPRNGSMGNMGNMPSAGYGYASPSGAPLGQSIVVSPSRSAGRGMPSALQAPLAPAAGGGMPRAQRMQRLQRILDSFEVSIADANDLAVLEDYEIVLILDDSSSMNNSAKPASQRRLYEESATRWDELKSSVLLMIDLAACFDESGLDLFFLNRGHIDGVKSSQDPRVLGAFTQPARGSTPLTEALRTVAEHCQGERPILLMIFTDGEPNGGVRNFEKELKRLVTKKSTNLSFRVQIMACTADEDAVGYLNDIDEKFGKVDVTDDYYSEMIEVLKKGRIKKTFSRGDWLMKAMLGPVSAKFDAWDETGVKKKHCAKHCDDSDCSDHSDAECGACSIS